MYTLHTIHITMIFVIYVNDYMIYHYIQTKFYVYELSHNTINKPGPRCVSTTSQCVIIQCDNTNAEYFSIHDTYDR